MANRLEWPGGKFVPELAGRVERELNSNGDAVYVGYAPRPDSRTDAEGWVIEYNVYTAANKLLTTYRRLGLTWNQRTAILALVFKKDFSPAFGTVQVVGRAAPLGIERGTARGTVVFSEPLLVYNIKVKASPGSIRQVKVLSTAKAAKIRTARAVGSIVDSALKPQPINVHTWAKAIGQVKSLAYATATKA